eukprot:g11278.t1
MSRGGCSSQPLKALYLVPAKKSHGRALGKFLSGPITELEKKSVLPISSSFPRTRPIPPIPDLGVADMEAFVVAAGFQLPGHLGRDYNAALRHDFNIAYRKIARQELTTPNSRTDSVALAKGALRLIKQGLSFRGQPEAENKFYRCEVGDQYTKESMKEWVEKCVAREMRQDKAHIQTFETAQQLVLCVMSVSALRALFPHVDRSFFVGWKRFRESERPQFSCTLVPFPYGRRKKESERLEWVGEGEERKQVRKVVYGVEDVEQLQNDLILSASCVTNPKQYMQKSLELADL